MPRCARRRPRDEEARRVAFVDDDGALGQGGAHGGRQRLGRHGAGGAVRVAPPVRGRRCRAERRAPRPVPRAPPAASSPGRARVCTVQPGGHQVARLVGVGEEGHRATWRRPGRGGGPRRAGPAPSRPGRPAGPPPGCRRPARGWRGRSRPAARRPSSRPPGWPRAGRRPASARPPSRSAARSPPRSALATSSMVSAGTTLRPTLWPGRARAGRRLGPRGVRREDQGGHAARGARGGRHRVGGVGGHVVGPCRGAVPPRHGAGDGRDVRLQRRVVAGVVGRMVAHDVDDRRPGPPGVVQVGQPVAEARARGAAAWPPAVRRRVRSRRRRR